MTLSEDVVVPTLSSLAPSFERSLMAANKSPRTVKTYKAALAALTVTFCLSDMSKLIALLEQVIAEERTSPEPPLNPAPLSLSIVPQA